MKRKIGKKVPYGVVRRYGRRGGKIAAGLSGAALAYMHTGGFVAPTIGYWAGRRLYKYMNPRMRYANIKSNDTVVRSNPGAGVKKYAGKARRYVYGHSRFGHLNKRRY